ncbi:MAG: hypothetical protein QW666_00865 [Candidatus Woesearchaeota archaeon]
MFQLQYSGGRFQELFYYLEDWGLSDVILPFILIFTIVFAVLSKIQLFAENKYNSVISLAIALMVVIPHTLGKYPPGMDIVTIINTALPEATLLIIAIVILLILTGLLWGEAPKSGLFIGIVAIIAILILASIFLSTITPIPIISNLDPRLITLIVGILVFGLIFLYVGSKGKPGAGGLIKALKELAK